MIFHQPLNSLSGYNYNTAFYTSEVWERHLHKNMELIYVLRGGVRCVVNNADYILREGDFGLCLPYDVHRYEPEADTQYWVLVFSEDYVHFFANQTVGKTGDGFRFRCSEETEQLICARLVNGDRPSIMTLKSCLYAVCEEYLENVPLIDKDQGKSGTVAEIADYVMKNHTKQISLSNVASIMGYDYNYTSRFFRKAFNMTFSDFVNLYRLETAIRLLDETNESITYVAYESGFQSLRSFNAFFRKNMKTSPSQYRRTARKYARETSERNEKYEDVCK